jgi:hypothetical protein
MTKHRLRILREASMPNGSLCPTALSAASHWWRAVNWLRANGLVVRPSGSHLAVATEQGRSRLKSEESAHAR